MIILITQCYVFYKFQSVFHMFNFILYPQSEILIAASINTFQNVKAQAVEDTLYIKTDRKECAK